MDKKYDTIETFADFDKTEIPANEKLGNILKNKRLTSVIELDKVASDLKVTKTDILALENGETIHAKNMSYSRLFVKKYLKYLGIELSDDLENLIDTVYPQSFDPTLTQKLDVDPISFGRELKKDRRKKNLKKNIISIIVIIILFAISFISVKYLMVNLKDTTIEVVNETTLLDETILEPAEIIEPEIVLADAEFVSYKNQKANYTLNNIVDNKYELVIKADSADCYVDVTDESGKYIGDSGVIAKGSEYKYDIDTKDDININLGNTTAAIITINGVELDLSKVTEPGKNNIILSIGDTNE